MAFFCARIANFSDKLNGFADLKNTVVRGSAANCGPDSGLCMSRSSDSVSDHSFSARLGRYFGVLSTNFFQFQFSSRHKIFWNHFCWTVTLDLQIDQGLDKLNAAYIFPLIFNARINCDSNY